MRGRSVRTMATVATVVTIAACAAAMVPAHAAIRTTTASVERRDLVERENVDGTLGYGASFDVESPRSGTITRLPAAGAVVERGQSLFDVDATPVPLLYGDLPMYRDLERGISDGADVRQLVS